MTINTPQFQEKRPKRGETILIATHNAGKVRELETFFTPFRFKLQTLADHNLPAPEETGTSFEANAELKAEHGRKATGYWTLADDSGLEVLTLNNAPGVDTAHFGGWEKLLDVLRETPETERQARFVCVLALQSPEGLTHFFKGICTGSITTTKQGDKGFGYDPIFRPEGQTRTFAEMTPDEKQKHSHRGAALHELAHWLDL